ncbi:MAG: hypothetical protein WCI43_05185 [Candidatus Firestonebacteria bacterium]
MKCKDAELLITKKVLGETSKEEEKLLRKHFRLCPACAKEYLSLGKIARKLKNYPVISEDPNFRQRVLARIDASGREGRKIPFQGFLFKFAVAAIVFIAVLAGYEGFYGLMSSDYDKILSYAKNSGAATDTTLNSSLQHRLAKELSSEKIDYITVANLENALFVSEKAGKQEMLLLLESLVRTKSERTLYAKIGMLIRNIFSDGSVAAFGRSGEDARLSEQLQTALACEKNRDYKTASEIYRKASKEKNLNSYSFELVKMLYRDALEEQKVFEKSGGLRGEAKIKALARCLDYQKIVEDFNQEQFESSSGKFIYAVSLSKSGYPLQSAAAFSELKYSEKTDDSFKTAVKMNLGVAADRVGFKDIAAGCFKEINTAGLAAPVDMKEYVSYVKYVIDSGSVPPIVSGAKSRAKRINGRSSVQIRPSGTVWSFGESLCLNNTWDGYDYFVFDVYNPGSNDLVMNVYVKPNNNGREGKLFRSTIAARPGYSTLEVDLRDVFSMSGSKMDFGKPISQWFIEQYGKTPKVFYVNNFRLEKNS